MSEPTLREQIRVLLPKEDSGECFVLAEIGKDREVGSLMLFGDAGALSRFTQGLAEHMKEKNDE